MMNWRDVSSYSRNEQERIPRSFMVKVGNFTITVTRKIHCEGWFLEWGGRTTSLLSSEAEDAKAEALELVKDHLCNALKELEQLSKGD